MKKSEQVRKKKKTSSRYNTTPAMPKESSQRHGFSAFYPGVGGAWSPKVGNSSSSRRIHGKAGQQANMNIWYGMDTFKSRSEISKTARIDKKKRPTGFKGK